MAKPFTMRSWPPYLVGVGLGVLSWFAFFYRRQAPRDHASIRAGTAQLDIWPFQPAAMLIGASLFGIGIAIIGYCPGTGMAGAGEGSRDAIVGVLGMVTGAGVFVAGYNALEPIALSLGDFGKITFPHVLGTSAWPIIAVLAVLLVAALWLTRSEKAGSGQNPSSGIAIS